MLRKLLVLAGAGFAAKKLTDRKRTADVPAMDRKMHRKGMPGNVRP